MSDTATTDLPLFGTTLTASPTLTKICTAVPAGTFSF